MIPVCEFIIFAVEYVSFLFSKMHKSAPWCLFNRHMTFNKVEQLKCDFFFMHRCLKFDTWYPFYFQFTNLLLIGYICFYSKLKIPCFREKVNIYIYMFLWKDCTSFYINILPLFIFLVCFSLLLFDKIKKGHGN